MLLFMITNTSFKIQTQFKRQYAYNNQPHALIYVAIGDSNYQIYYQYYLMNKIGDRRKIHTKGALNSQDQAQLVRMTTNAVLYNNAPPSIDQLKKLIKQLQKQLKNEKQLRISAQENLELYQLRSIARQKQFHRILQQSDQKVRSYVKMNESSETVREIKKTYEEVLKNFENTNAATNLIIQNKYKQNLEAMERRISTIISLMNEEVSRTKKMSSKNVDEIRKQIQLAISIVKNNQVQNLQLRINIKQQKHKNKLLQEERNLLLQEVVNKKLIIAKLLQQNKNMKVKFQKDKTISNQYKSKQFVIKESKDEMQSTNRKFQTVCNSQLFNTKQTVLDDRSLVYKDVSYTEQNSRQKQKKKQISHSRLSASSDKQSRSYKLSKFENTAAKIRYNKNSLTSTNQIQASHPQYRKLQKRFRKNITVIDDGVPNQFGKSQCLVTLNLNETINQQQGYQKIISHFRNCLQREKRKNAQLSKMVTKITNQNQEVNQAIFQLLRNFKGKNNQSDLNKYQNLINLIKQMKKRLSMCEKPTIKCGWGQDQLQQLVQSLQQKTE